MAADFNMHPSELQDHPVFQELGGLIVSAGRGTCSTTGGWKEYDYFIVDPRLKPFIMEVVAVEDAHTSPHLPVRLRLRARAADLVQRVPKMPKRLPVLFAAGCAPRPPEWPEIPSTLTCESEATSVWSVLA
eukprot:12057309-Karenia_brevis.AAC.1